MKNYVDKDIVDPHLDDVLEKVVEIYSKRVRPKNKRTAHIRLKKTGQILRLSSGKSAWGGIGHAKAALRLDFHIPHVIPPNGSRWSKYHPITGKEISSDAWKALHERMFERFCNECVIFEEF